MDGPPSAGMIATAMPPTVRISRGVTSEDRYFFDLNGFIVVPDVINEPTLERLNRRIEERAEEVRPTAADPYSIGFNDLPDLGPDFRALIDQPIIADYLEDWLGPGYRLDHDYGMIIRPDSPRPGGAFHIHGGGHPYHPSRAYTCLNGRIFAGETAVSFALTDVPVGAGGMGVVPGSHKSCLPLPWAASPGPYPDGLVHQVPLRAGSAVIFTETLTHCTMPWTAKHERRTLFYKYTPRNTQLNRKGYDASRWPDLSERQRALLEPAYTPRQR
jgi:hypothetical protein